LKIRTEELLNLKLVTATGKTYHEDVLKLELHLHAILISEIEVRDQLHYPSTFTPYEVKLSL
jgi:hypothetical protein